jgi:hypothetical protein
MHKIVVIPLAMMMSVAFGAQESGQESDRPAEPETAAASGQPVEQEKLSGSEKKRLQDQAVAAMVEEYNEAVDDDMDEVVCTKERVTGSRRKVRVCKTRRQIAEEQAASKRAIRMRNRSSSGPAEGDRMGSE